LVSYQSPCSNLYAFGRNWLHEDPRSNCSAPGDFTWFCSCFPVVHRRFSFVSERRCGAVRSDCRHCSVLSVSGTLAEDVQREEKTTLGKETKIKKKINKNKRTNVDLATTGATVSCSSSRPKRKTRIRSDNSRSRLVGLQYRTDRRQ